MKVDADEIRKAFPNPSSGSSYHTPRGYCVGGAFLNWINYSISPEFSTKELHSFPPINIVSRALQLTNPNLSKVQYDDFARNIISYNDEGEFDKAWMELERAFSIE